MKEHSIYINQSELDNKVSEFNSINLEKAERLEMFYENDIDFKYEYRFKREFKNFLGKLFNWILVGDVIINKDTDEIREIEKRNNQFFLNPFNNKWYSLYGDNSTEIKRVPFLRIWYCSDRYYCDHILPFDQVKLKEIVSKVEKRLAEIKNKLFINLNEKRIVD